SMASGVVSTGLAFTPTGMAGASESPRTISDACCSTVRSASSPYRLWLPVRNQTASSRASIVNHLPEGRGNAAVDMASALEPALEHGVDGDRGEDDPAV